MVKKLHDICLQCIGDNLHCISRVGKFLPTKHKEILLQRLVDHDMLTPEYLPHITYHLFSPAVRSITFKRCPQVTDHVLGQLDSCECKLQSIVIDGCDNVSDVGLQTLFSKQDGLRRLELRNLPHLTSKGLEAISSPCLEEVSLYKCANVTDIGVRTLVTKNPTISKLNLGFCYKVTDEVVPDIAHCLGENLLHLDLGFLQSLSDTNVGILAQNCPNIKILVLQGCNRSTGECLKMLFSKCNRMQCLDISFCHKILEPSNNLEFLPTSITKLVLGGLIMIEGQELLDNLARLPKLEDLQMCGINMLTDDNIKGIFRAVGSQLTNLDMSGCQQCLDDFALRHIVKYCTELEGLSLCYCPGLKGTALLDVMNDERRAKQLVEIRLSGCRAIEYNVVEAMSVSCPNLEKLYLSGVLSVTDQILLSVANNCPKLDGFSVKSCSSQVTDLGVVEIARCCPLEEIVLSGVHSITDKSILALANNCLDLVSIYVSGCNKVTPASINYLKDVCNGRVYVQHKVPNLDPNQVMAKNLDTGEFCRVDQMH